MAIPKCPECKAELTEVDVWTKASYAGSFTKDGDLLLDEISGEDEVTAILCSNCGAFIDTKIIKSWDYKKETK